MYNWFKKYLQLGQPEPVVERPFVPVPPGELSVFDEQHPRPADATGVEALRKTISKAADRQIAALAPKDQTTLNEFRRIVGTALRVMIGDKLPEADDVQELAVKPAQDQKGVHWRKLLLGRKGEADRIPAVVLHGPEVEGQVVA